MVAHSPSKREIRVRVPAEQSVKTGSVVRTFHLVDDDSQQERTKGITRVAGIAVLNCAVSNKVVVIVQLYRHHITVLLVELYINLIKVFLPLVVLLLKGLMRHRFVGKIEHKTANDVFKQSLSYIPTLVYLTFRVLLCWVIKNCGPYRITDPHQPKRLARACALLSIYRQ
ncbi:hypothetical protein J6590_090507 [Homalodisca vitripennis]|nr:hypothetical protein J6590_090507 [Homalodisca vitripennis]